ncbi:hypothetical protein CRUP_031572 [Coryphaenoides rupestris]|nr:hypothetical protein CRUP_031572 [Coryphaenoides rupestris]
MNGQNGLILTSYTLTKRKVLNGVVDHVLDEVGLQGGEGSPALSTRPLQLGRRRGRQLGCAWRHAGRGSTTHVVGGASTKRSLKAIGSAEAGLWSEEGRGRCTVSEGREDVKTRSASRLLRFSEKHIATCCYGDENIQSGRAVALCIKIRPWVEPTTTPEPSGEKSTATIFLSRPAEMKSRSLAGEKARPEPGALWAPSNTCSSFLELESQSATVPPSDTLPSRERFSGDRRRSQRLTVWSRPPLSMYWEDELRQARSSVNTQKC